MRKEEIIEGGIYVFDKKFLNKITLKDSLNVSHYIDLRDNTFYSKPCTNGSYPNYKEATPEEKHWLETCITLDEFISKKDSLKNFIEPTIDTVDQDFSYLIKFFNGKGIK